MSKSKVANLRRRMSSCIQDWLLLYPHTGSWAPEGNWWGIRGASRSAQVEAALPVRAEVEDTAHGHTWEPINYLVMFGVTVFYNEVWPHLWWNIATVWNTPGQGGCSATLFNAWKLNWISTSVVPPILYHVLGPGVSSNSKMRLSVRKKICWERPTSLYYLECMVSFSRTVWKSTRFY